MHYVSHIITLMMYIGFVICNNFLSRSVISKIIDENKFDACYKFAHAKHNLPRYTIYLIRHGNVLDLLHDST